MPRYVQRNFAGEVIGIYSAPAVQDDGFCLTDPDPLPDDHPDILAFLARHPMPHFPPPTEKDFREATERQKRTREESDKLGQLTLAHLHAWSSLELAMSGFFQQMLNIQGKAVNLARAIYFSIPGFDQRTITVGKALEQFVEDHLQADRKQHMELKHLTDSWARIETKMRSARRDRNVIAHGSISIMPHGGTFSARLTAPVFDPIRVGALMAKGTNPGLGIAEMEKAVQIVHKLARCIDRMNDSVTAFHQFGLPALLKTRARLEANLQALEALA